MKRKTKTILVDIVIILFCLTGTFFSGAAFWQEYNTTFEKTNEEPVGTIIFKKRSAERRFVDRDIWDRLKQSSPVYNGDRIRTSEQSEAIIIFQDTVTYLNMDESTIIQIFYDDKSGTQIDFSGGNLEIASNSNDLFVSSGDSLIRFDGQTRLYKDDDGFNLSVLEGQASFDGRDIESGKILALDSSGEIDTRPVLAMNSFGSAATVLGMPGEAVPVEFSWNASGFNPDTHVIVEIALDRQFNKIVETQDVIGTTSISIPMQNGTYWWRAFPAEAGSREAASRSYPSGSIEIGYTATTTLFTPVQKAELTFSGDSSVRFSWSTVENSISYLLEISAQPDISSPVISRQVRQSTVIQSGLENGHWYWRVTPIFPLRVKAPALVSEIGEFSIAQGLPILPKPVLTSPTSNGKIYADSPSNWLLWEHHPDAVSWNIVVADNPNLEKPVIMRNVVTNYFSVPQTLIRNRKTYYWQVSALGGKDPAVSDIWSFEIVSEPPPSVKPVVASVPYIPSIVFDANTGFEGNPDIERLLSRIAATLNENSEYRVRIEGHANPTINPRDVAGRQREQIEELQPLSELRAKDIADQLIKLGIDPRRLEYYGTGGERPITAWEDTANWWKNRRVEFILTK